ncbi:MAG: filamentous hemagglutinin N-terminal domain-containing protein [Candidatus Gastranaerophilales bacterium]|nr:filamentous hemagglutinin N-terminal domain-containing protein [Candidatus Gastranaerophilales bacterium]
MRKIRRNIQKLSSKKDKLSLNVKKTAILAGVALAMSLNMGMSSFALDPNTLPTSPIIIQNSEVTSDITSMNIKTTGSVGEVSFDDYSIGSSATVNYEFTAAGQASLSRVRGSNPSQIFGNITQSGSNGAVFLLNPNGILFGAGSSINVDSFAASTHNNASYTTDPVTGKLNTISLSRTATPQGIYFESGANINVTNSASFATNAIYSLGNISGANGNVQLVTGDGVDFTFEVSPINNNLQSQTVTKDNINTPAVTAGLPENVEYPGEHGVGNQAIEVRGGLITGHNIQAVSAINAPVMARELVNLSGVMTANAFAGEDGSIYVYANNDDPVGSTDMGLVSARVGKILNAGNGSITVESNRLLFSTNGGLQAGEVKLQASTNGKEIHLGDTSKADTYNVGSSCIDKITASEIIVGNGTNAAVSGEIALKKGSDTPINFILDTSGDIDIDLLSTHSSSTLGVTDANTITIDTVAGNTLNLGDVFKSAGAVDLTADTIIAMNSDGIDIGGTFTIKKKTTATPVDFTLTELNSLFSSSATYGGAITIGVDGFEGDVTGTSLNFSNQDVTVLSIGDVDLSGISNAGTINVASNINRANDVVLSGDITSLGDIYSGNNVDLTVASQPVFNGDIIASDIYYTQTSGSFALTNIINNSLISTGKRFNIADTFSISGSIVDLLDAGFTITANNFTAGGNLLTLNGISLVDRNGIHLTGALFDTYSTPYFGVETLANDISIVDEISRVDQFIRLDSAAGIISLAGVPEGSLSVYGTASLNMTANSLIDVKVGGNAPISASGTIVKIAGINDDNIEVYGISASGSVEVSSENNLFVSYVDTLGDVILTADSDGDNSSSLTIGLINGNVITLNADDQLILNPTSSVNGNTAEILQSDLFELSQTNIDQLNVDSIEITSSTGISLNGTIDAANKNFILSSAAFDYTTTPGSSLSTTGDLTLHQASGDFALNTDLIDAFVTDDLKLYSDEGTFTLGADLTVADRNVALHAPTAAIDLNANTIDLGTGLLEAYASDAVELKLASEKVKAGCSSINIEGTGLTLDVQSLSTNGDITVLGAGAVKVADIATAGNVSLTGTSLELGNVFGGNILFNTNSYVLDGTEDISTPGTLTLAKLNNGALTDTQEGVLLQRVSNAPNIVLGSDSNTGGVNFNTPGSYHDFHSSNVLVNTSGYVYINDVRGTGYITVDHGPVGYGSEAAEVSISGRALKFNDVYSSGAMFLVSAGTLDVAGAVTAADFVDINNTHLDPGDLVLGDWTINGDVTSFSNYVFVINVNGGAVTLNNNIQADGTVGIWAYDNVNLNKDITSNSYVEVASDADIIQDAVSTIAAGNSIDFICMSTAGSGDFTLNGTINTLGNLELSSGGNIFMNGAITANGASSSMAVDAIGNIETAGAINVTNTVLMTADSDSTGNDHIAIGNTLSAGGAVTFNADSLFSNTGIVTAEDGDLITINANSFNISNVITSHNTGANIIKLAKVDGNLVVSNFSLVNLVADTLEFDANNGSLLFNSDFDSLGNNLILAASGTEGKILTGDYSIIHGAGTLNLTAVNDIDAKLKGTGTVSASTTGGSILKLEDIEADEEFTVGAVTAFNNTEVISKGNLVTTGAIDAAGTVILTADSDSVGTDEYMTIGDSVTGSQVTMNIDDGLTLNGDVTSDALDPLNQMITINSNADIVLTNTDNTSYHIPISKLHSKNITFNNASPVALQFTTDPSGETIDADSDILYINTGIYAPRGPITAEHIYVNADTIGLNSDMVNGMVSPITLTANNIRVLDDINIMGKEYDLTATNMFDFVSTGASITTDEDITITAGIFDFTYGSLSTTGNINLIHTSGDFTLNSSIVSKLTSNNISISTPGIITLADEIMAGGAQAYTLTASDYLAGTSSKLDTTGVVTVHDTLGDLSVNDATVEVFGSGTLKIFADDTAAGDIAVIENIAVTDRDLFLNAQGDILTGTNEINLGTGALDLTAVGDIQARIASSDVSASGANIDLVGTGPTLNVLSLTTTSSDVNISGNILNIADFAIDGNAIILGTDVTTGTIATGGDTSVTGTGTVIVGDIDATGDVQLSGDALTLNDVEGDDISLYSNNFTMTGGKFIIPGADATVVISDVAHNTLAADAHFRDVYNAINNTNSPASIMLGDNDYAGDVDFVDGLDLVADTRVNTTGYVSIGDTGTGAALSTPDGYVLDVYSGNSLAQTSSIGILGYTATGYDLNLGTLTSSGDILVITGVNGDPLDFGGLFYIGDVTANNFEVHSPVSGEFKGDINTANAITIYSNGDVTLTGDVTDCASFFMQSNPLQVRPISPGIVGDYLINGSITSRGDVEIDNIAGTFFGVEWGKLDLNSTIIANGNITLNTDRDLTVGLASHLTSTTAAVSLASNANIVVNGDIDAKTDVNVNSGSSNVGDFILVSTGSINAEGNVGIVSEENIFINGSLTANGTDSTLSASAKGNIETAGVISVAKQVDMTADSDSTGDDYITIGNVLTAGGAVTFNADSLFANIEEITATNGDLITVNADAFDIDAIITSDSSGVNTIKLAKTTGDMVLTSLSAENLVSDTVEFDANDGSISIGTLSFTDRTNLTLKALGIDGSITSTSTTFDNIGILDLTANGAIDIYTGVIDSIAVNSATDLSINGGTNDVTLSLLPASITGDIDLSGEVITAPDMNADGQITISGTSLALNNITAGTDVTLTGSGSIVVGDISTTGDINISDPISGVTTGSITGNSVNVLGTVVQVGDINVSDDSSLTGTTSLEMVNITGTGDIDFVLKSSSYTFDEPAAINIPAGTLYIAAGLSSASVTNVIAHVASAAELVLGDSVCTENVDLDGLVLSRPIRVSTKGYVNLTGLTGTELLSVDTLDPSLANQASYVRLISADPSQFNVGDVKSNGDIVLTSAAGAELNFGDLTSNGNITTISDNFGTSGEIRANALTGVVNIQTATDTLNLEGTNIANLMNNIEQANEIHIGKQHGYQGNVIIHNLDVTPIVSVSTSGNVTLDNIVNAGQINVNNDDSGYNFCSEAKLVTLSGNISSLGTVYAADNIVINNNASTGTLNIEKIRTKKDIELTSGNSIALLASGQIYGATDIGSSGIVISSNGNIDLNGLVYSLKAANIESSGYITEDVAGSIRAYGDLYIAADGGAITLNGITYGNQNLIVNSASDVIVGGTLYQRTTAGTLDITSGGDILTVPYEEPDEGMIKSKNILSLFAEGDINILVDSETYPNVDVIYAGGDVEIREPITLFSMSAPRDSSVPDQLAINNLENALADSNSSSDTSQDDSNDDNSAINGLDEINP